jgi:hypothetical protein
MNVNRWFSIVNKKKKWNWSKPSTIPDPYLSPQFSIYLFEFFSSLYTSVNLFVNRWHTIPREVCKTLTTCNQKNQTKPNDTFYKKDVEKWKTATGDIMLSFISEPHGRLSPALKSPSFHFLFFWVFCYDKIYRQFVSLDLKGYKKKLAPSRRSP